MIKVVQQFMVDGEDSFYLYHPEISETVTSHGEQIGAIGNYNTDGWKFPLSIAFRQTLYVLMAEPITYRKYFIIATDRMTDANALQMAMQINDNEMIDCHFVFIGIGEQYDHNLLSKFGERSNVTYFHIEDPDNLDPAMFKENENGENDTQCKTSEQHQSIQLSGGHSCSVSRTVRSGDAVDEQFVSSNEEQLLQADFGGRLQSEPRFHNEAGSECSEKCGQTEATKHIENHTE